MFNKIEDIILLGIKVSFKTYINQVVITMKKDKDKLTQILPFDHLYESRVCDLLDWMKEEVLKNN